MGEAARRKKAGDYPDRKFKPGIVNVQGKGRYIARDGRVYELRVGPRINDPIEAELTRQAATAAGLEVAPPIAAEPESVSNE